MAAILWEQLRDRVRDRAGQVTTQPTKSFITDAQLDIRLNESFAAFHNLLVELQHHEWSLTDAKEAEATLTAGLSRYKIPADTMALKSVRISDGNWTEEVLPLDHPERARLEGTINPTVWRWGYRYRIVGGDLLLLPIPSSNVSRLFVTYITEWRELTTGQKVEVPYGWWLWPVLHCAIGMVHTRFPGEAANALMSEWQAEDARIRGLAGHRSPRALYVVSVRDDVWEDDYDLGYGVMWPS